MKVVSLLLVLISPVFAEQLKLEFVPTQIQAWQSYLMVERLRSNVFPEVSMSVEPRIPLNQELVKLPPERVEELKVQLWLAQNDPPSYLKYLELTSLSPYESDWRGLVNLLGLDSKKIEGVVKGDWGAKALAGATSLPVAARLSVGGAEVPFSWDLGALAQLINERLPADGRKKNLVIAAAKKVENPPVELIIVSAEDVAGWARMDPKMLEGVKRLPLQIKETRLKSSDSKAKDILRRMGVPLAPAVFFKTSDKAAQKILDDLAKRGALETKPSEKNLYFIRAFSSSGVLTNSKEDATKGLQLFVMSQCPYGVMAQKAMLAANASSTFPKGVALNFHYILSRMPKEGGGFEYRSLHGRAELEEDIRQMIVQNNFGDKLMCYLAERLKAIDSSLWADALDKCSIDQAKFEKLYKETGSQLLDKEYSLSESYNISSSPTFLWKNRYLLVGLDGLKGIDEFKNVDFSGASGGGTMPAGKCQ